ncbi:RebB family R body protein [Dyella japonica]|uniref:Killing trait domain-containing protein n=1 Tax=Dyella japonica TaxID=231455 RepID=A0ABV2K1X9_9GAMM
MSTQIDSQVTDPITQTNPQVLGGAPATALGNLYQATAHALGNAAQNAVNCQQQNDILVQAATTQAVMQLLSIGNTGNVASLEENKPSAAAQSLEDLTVALAKIERVVESPNKLGIDNAGPWSHAAQEMMNTVAGALREFQRVSQETGMAMVKQAAIASVLVHMINAPDQLQQYQKILELIDGL